MTNVQEKMTNVQGQVANAVESAREAAHNVGAKVSDFFQGNPFETAVGRKIELATDATKLATENWGLIMEVTDFINSTNDGGRDAVRAIRKRLQTQMGKNNAIVMYTLTVLETCVKNCDQRFKALVCQKEFVNELVKLIGAKHDAPQIVQERVLLLIQSWADAFRGNQALSGVCEVYDELKSKGVEFPATNLDSLAPIITPKRTVFTGPSQPQPQHGDSHNAAFPTIQTAEYAPFVGEHLRGPISASPEQLAKLRSELDVVNVNLAVLRELLGTLTPNQESDDEFGILEALHATTEEMRRRVHELIPLITNEEVTYELLSINDEFVNVFEKYNRYMAHRANSQSEKPGSSGLQSFPTSVAASTNPVSAQQDLMDFGTRDDPNTDAKKLTDKLEAINVNDTPAASTPAPKKSPEKEGSYVHDQTDVGLHKAAFNKTEPISDREASEISSWLTNTEKGVKEEPKKDDGL